MARRLGYVRATVAFPDLDAQTDRIAQAGAETVFVEKDRPGGRVTMRERRRLFGQIKPGDDLIVESFDRLGTSFDDLFQCFALLVGRGVNVRVLDADFASGGPDGPAYSALLNLFAGARKALSSDLIRTNMAAARAKGGRTPGTRALLTPDQWPEIKRKLETGTREAVAAEFGVHRQTLWAFRRRMIDEESRMAQPAPPLRTRRLKN